MSDIVIMRDALMVRPKAYAMLHNSDNPLIKEALSKVEIRHYDGNVIFNGTKDLLYDILVISTCNLDVEIG